VTGLQRSMNVAVSAQNILSKTGWFSEQPADFQDRMKAIARWRKFRAGENLYETGDDPGAVFGLEDGLLDVAIPLSTDEMVNIWRAQPGFWFGDSALLADKPRGISITAFVDCMVLVIPGPALRRHLSQMPQDFGYFYRLSHRNVMLTLQVLAEVLAMSPRERFARLLLRFASQEGVVHMTQTEIGALSGMSRAAFRRSFSDLIKNGVVKTEYGVLRILDRGALEKVAKF
jgi:CRP/FNR family cyclic AMP-dependent transcriptional regulator